MHAANPYPPDTDFEVESCGGGQGPLTLVLAKDIFRLLRLIFL